MRMNRNRTHAIGRHERRHVGRDDRGRRVPLLLWPFWALWTLVATVVGLVGRVIALVLGMVLMLVGAIFTVTIIGAVVGIPLLLFGLVLVVRSVF